MGNHPNKQSPKKETSNKITLKVQHRNIIVHHAYKMVLNISDTVIFPHNHEGLKLWDVDIVGARYSILRSDEFKNKKVFCLNSGVGLTGITMKKWTDCESVVMSEYYDEMVSNIKKNCDKNKEK